MQKKISVIFCLNKQVQNMKQNLSKSISTKGKTKHTKREVQSHATLKINKCITVVTNSKHRE